MALDLRGPRFNHRAYRAIARPRQGQHYMIRDIQTLTDYLPNANRLMSLRGNRPKFRRDIILRNSRLYNSDAVGAHELMDIWNSVLDAITEEDTPAGGAGIKLMSWLEEKFNDERQRHRGYTSFPGTLLAFQCLAEMSFMSRSPYIASILSQFFMKYGRSISQSEADEANLEWCLAIYSTNMLESEMCVCLREILSVCPDVLGFQGYRLDDFLIDEQSFWDFLNDIWQRMQESDWDDQMWMDRGRGRLRRYGNGFRAGRDYSYGRRGNHRIGYGPYGFDRDWRRFGRPKLFEHDPDDTDARLEYVEDALNCLMKGHRHYR
jgi:hypothetical protein